MAALLKPDRVRKENVGLSDITINEKIIPDSFRAPKNVASYVPKGAPIKPTEKLGGNGRPRGITIHNTNDINVAAGTNAAEQYARATYNGNMNGVVVHYYVWDNDIWQILSETERGWHAGDGTKRKVSKNGKTTLGGNMDTIAIESIGNRAGSEDTTAKLAAYLSYKHGLNPETDIYAHQYWSGKECPLYILPHWNEFLARVKKYYDQIVETQEAAPVFAQGSAKPNSKKLYRVQSGAYAIRKNAEALAKRLEEKGFPAIIKYE